MCGRLSCSLCEKDVLSALSYVPLNSTKYTTPVWRNASNGGRKYTPSKNVSPRDVTPVLLSGAYFKEEAERIVQPMMWGMIPNWHKGDMKSFKLSTINCRLEGIGQSKMYSKTLWQNKRCVVVCDGFYEWSKNKQPYFIYMPQPDCVKIEDENTWNIEFDENKGWKGPNMLKMAALFDSWTSPEGEEIFSYSIMTIEAKGSYSKLHHRIPVILDSEELLSQWLNFGHIIKPDELGFLRSVECLKWHAVSKDVNKVKKKSDTCNKPYTEEQKSGPMTKSASLMEAWLNVPRKRPSSGEESYASKNPKTDSA